MITVFDSAIDSSTTLTLEEKNLLHQLKNNGFDFSPWANMIYRWGVNNGVTVKRIGSKEAIPRTYMVAHFDGIKKYFTDAKKSFREAIALEINKKGLQISATVPVLEPGKSIGELFTNPEYTSSTTALQVAPLPGSTASTAATDGTTKNVLILIGVLASGYVVYKLIKNSL